MVRKLTVMRSMKITHKLCKNKSPAEQSAGRKDFMIIKNVTIATTVAQID